MTTPIDLPLDLKHTPADYAEAVEMLHRAKGLLGAANNALSHQAHLLSVRDRRIEALQAEIAAQALEQARCAYVNLNNMVRMMPALKAHPLLPMVKLQLGSAIEALGDTSFCEIEDRQQ